jgi:hypothetical protein
MLWVVIDTMIGPTQTALIDVRHWLSQVGMTLRRISVRHWLPQVGMMFRRIGVMAWLMQVSRKNVILWLTDVGL